MTELQTFIVAVVGGVVLGVNVALLAAAATFLWCAGWRHRRHLVPAARHAWRVLVEIRRPVSARTTLPLTLRKVGQR